MITLTVVFHEKTLRVVQVQGDPAILANRTVCKGVLADAMRHIDKHVDQLESGKQQLVIVPAGAMPSNGEPH